VRQIRYIFHVGIDAFYTFLADDGWAIASHIALSTLMALFPFLIVLTSLAGFFGSKELADQAAGLMLQVWPKQVADSLSGEIHDVLTTTRGDILTIGAVLAVYFASNGVEALRIALNRAYSVVETRPWYWLRLESIGYTLVAAVTALAMAFLIVLGPLMLEAARRHIPLVVENNEQFLNVSRYSVTITALIVAHADDGVEAIDRRLEGRVDPRRDLAIRAIGVVVRRAQRRDALQVVAVGATEIVARARPRHDAPHARAGVPSYGGRGRTMREAGKGDVFPADVVAVLRQEVAPIFFGVLGLEHRELSLDGRRRGGELAEPAGAHPVPVAVVQIRRGALGEDGSTQ